MSIDKVLKVEDITNLSYDILIEAYRNGYKLEETNPGLLYATQQISDVTSTALTSMTAPATLTVQVGQKINPIICRSSSGTVIACPSISWSRSSRCCANLWTDGTIEGVSEGSLNVRPYDSVTGIQGNVIAVTVVSARMLSQLH